MDTAQPARSLAVGLLVGLAASFALLLAHFTFQFPTSDYRVRLYFMLAAEPIALSAVYFGATFIVASLATALAGVRDRWAFVGGGMAALIAVTALWLHVFSYLVWMHEEDVTTTGIVARVAVAVLVGSGAILLARRGRLTSA
jgi:hypothetical protein